MTDREAIEANVEEVDTPEDKLEMRGREAVALRKAQAVCRELEDRHPKLGEWSCEADTVVCFRVKNFRPVRYAFERLEERTVVAVANEVLTWAFQQLYADLKAEMQKNLRLIQHNRELMRWEDERDAHLGFLEDLKDAIGKLEYECSERTTAPSAGTAKAS